jgi:hypothetical protein
MMIADQKAGDRTVSIPEFLTQGVLPPGVHSASLSEIRQRFGSTNPSTRRGQLHANLEALLTKVATFHLFGAAIIDGSFVTDKPIPDDIDVGLELADVYESSHFNLFLESFDFDRLRTEQSLDVYLFVRNGLNDFRRFFQYLRTEEAIRRNLPAGSKKGILEVPL